VLAFIGLFNIVGAISAGLLAAQASRNAYLLSVIISCAPSRHGVVLAPMSASERDDFRARHGHLVALDRPVTSALVGL